MSEDANTYTVRVDPEGRGWLVVIADVDGEVVFRRSCRDEAEARTFASTVQQHVYWLSATKFREYYKIPAGR